MAAGRGKQGWNPQRSHRRFAPPLGDPGGGGFWRSVRCRSLDFIRRPADTLYKLSQLGDWDFTHGSLKTQHTLFGEPPDPD
jgi:hypothetical protein